MKLAKGIAVAALVAASTAGCSIRSETTYVRPAPAATDRITAPPSGYYMASDGRYYPLRP